ncbi:MAG: nuclear transport factor 2 family protein [Terriglobales bacterium]
MKQFLRVSLLVSFGCILTAAQTESASRSSYKGNNVKDQLVKLEQQWATAQEKGDKAALSRILSNDYKFTDLDGKTGTKRELLENLQTSVESSGAERAKEPGYEVQVYGNTAVVTHNAVFKGKDATVEARGMDVWIKHGPNWQVVAHQWTVVSGPRGEALPKEFLARCAAISFQPEVHSLYGNPAVIISKLENDAMGLPERRGYLLLIETEGSAELDYFDRVNKQESKVLHWEGKSVAELREKLTSYILANRGIACVGAQTKALVNASFKLSDLGQIPTPLSATAAFSHMIRKYGDSYLRVSVLLLC